MKQFSLCLFTIHCVVFISLAVLDAQGQARRLQFKYLTVDEGLSSSSVTSILRDHKGFMWIGTYNGLNRYDGFQFIVYKNHSADTTSLSHNLVWTLFEDREQRLLIGTSAGLCLYDWCKDSFYNYMRDSNSPLNGLNCNVRCMTEDTHGNLWLATNIGLIYFDRVNHQIVHYNADSERSGSLSDNDVEYVFIDSHNRLWVSTRKGLNRFDSDKKVFYRIDKTIDNRDISNTFFQDITEDREGNLWFGSFEGLFCLKHTNNRDHKWRLIHYCYHSEDKQSLSSNRILCLYIGKQDDLWIGTENGGLNVFDKQKQIFYHYLHDEYNPNSLNNESVHAIYQDENENFWIGTFNGGINISKINSEAILHYQNLPGIKTSLSHNSVTAFMEDRSGRIWIGTDGGGLNLFHLKTGSFSRFNTENTNLNSDAVLSIIQDSKGQIWLTTWAGGVSRFDETRKSFQSFTTNNSHILDDNIFAAFEDKKGRLWLGSMQSGLICFDRQKKSFIHYTSENSNLSNNMIVVIKQHLNGDLLLGTPSGFNIFDTKDKHFTSYSHDPNNPNSISSGDVYDIFIQNDTTIWIGTQNGLNRFNPITESFIKYDQQNGLIDPAIKGIAEDESGQLWVSTNKGISRFDPETGIAKNFTKADGLQSNEFNNHSIMKLKNNAILMGGKKGFNLIYPEKIRENTNVPNILITDFLIFNKLVPIGVAGSPLEKHISETTDLELSYRQSVLTFGFAVMDFTMPEKNQYAYMMEGFEKEWNYIHHKKNVTYTNLDPGKYVFRVKGSNNDGVWNEKGASINIAITPPLYKTLWFQTVTVFFTVLLLYVGYQIRTAQMRQRNRELEQRILKRTMLLEEANQELEAFTYSVSHDLRAPLRSMDGFSKIMLEDYSDQVDERGKDYLRRIDKASKRMGQMIDSILKLFRLSRSKIYFEEVNISEMVESIFSEYQQMHPEREIEIVIAKHVHAIGDMSLLNVLFRNLIDNAWKFTKDKAKAQIEFGVIQQDNKSVYFVRDNGVGFNMAYSENLFEAFQRQHKGFEGSGIGLATVKRIVLRHGGRIWAEGKENEGATFYFTFK